jgi:thiamine kinase-like enzyme
MSNTLLAQEINWIKQYHSVAILKTVKIEAALTNDVFLLYFADGSKLLFKRLNLDARNTEERYFEIDIQSHAALFGLSAKIIASTNNFRLQEYIEGQSLEGAFVNDDLLKLLAKQLQRIHSLQQNVAMPQQLALELTRLAQQIEEKNIVFDKIEFAKFLMLAKELDKSCDKKTLCHGDLSLNNIIKTESGEIKIIDWEYAVAACPAYDLAFCFCINKFNDAEQTILVDTYYLLQTKSLPSSLMAFKANCQQYFTLFNYISRLWKIVFGKD